jgi:hypothetical protein
MPRPRSVIPALQSNESPWLPNENPFEIGDLISVFDAAMVYSGRHPTPNFFHKGTIEEHEKWLRAGIPKDDPRSQERIRARCSWDIYCELKKGIENGIIKPVRVGYQGSGEIDPRRTRIRTADLAMLAAERGESPEYLRHLLAGQKLSRDTAIKALLAEGIRPGGDPAWPWKRFCAEIRDRADGWINRDKGKSKRGFADKAIDRAARALMERTRSL